MGDVTSVRFAWHHAKFWEQWEVGNSKMAISWESWIYRHVEFQTQIWWIWLPMDNKLVYLMCDYNIDLYNSETHDLTKEFVDVMNCNEFLPLISQHTVTTNGIAICMDIIFSPIVMSIWIVHSIVCWWLLYLTTSQFSILIDLLQFCIVTWVFRTSRSSGKQFRH